VWLARTRKIRKDAAAVGKTFDDIAAEHAASRVPFRFAERIRNGGGDTTDVEKCQSPRQPNEEPKSESRILATKEEEAGDNSNTRSSDSAH